MKKRFKKIYLEISNICNLQCSFCPEVERNKFSVSGETLRSRLLKVREFTERVCYHVMGEPSGHPEFLQLVRVAESLRVPLEITTNGTKLTDEVIEALLNPTVIQVNFSLQSFLDNFPAADPETYFKKIFNFCHLALKNRSDLYINFRLWNLSEPTESKTDNLSIIGRIEKEFKVALNSNVDVGFKKSKRVLGRLYLHFDSRFQWPSLAREEISSRGTCYGLKSHIAVLSEGTVVPCCLDKEADLKLGHLDEEGLEEILNGRRALEMRKGFDQGVLNEELCRRCDYVRRFSPDSTSKR